MSEIKKLFIQKRDLIAKRFQGVEISEEIRKDIETSLSLLDLFEDRRLLPFASDIVFIMESELRRLEEAYTKALNEKFQKQIKDYLND